jgi:mono/diheme cytochrome c family protein
MPFVMAQTVNPAVAETDAALIQRGAYLARVGDCVACHTAVIGRSFAGVLALNTPVGIIYSTNITPDKTHGIGDYSYQDFDNAVRHGVGKDGASLYPAMPYPSYAKVKPSDMRALYAYFIHGVAPVAQGNKDANITWPMSMRWPLALWRIAFAPAVDSDDGLTQVDTSTIGRGKYLVEGLGHCSACHTPRGFAFQEKALSDARGKSFLSGGEVDGWFAKNLRGDQIDGLGRWSEEDIVNFLQSGRNAHSAAFGGMGDVVENSTQYMSHQDLESIAAYLKSLAPVKADKDTGRAIVYEPAAAAALHGGDASAPGALLYLNNCVACHRSTGKGYEGVFPALALSSTVNTDNATSLIHLVLTGSAMVSTSSAPTSFSMPGFATRLTDEQLAQLISFVRRSWGNHAGPVTADAVAAVRKDLKHTERD